jgi:hypothetical protein
VAAKHVACSQNPVGFGNGFGKSGQMSAFSSKSKVAFPKAEVLGKSLYNNSEGWLLGWL